MSGTDLVRIGESTSVDAENPWADDRLRREPYAKFLTGLLRTQNAGYVLNLDGAWGCGKTFFLKRWHESLKSGRFDETQHASIYFSAWEVDYMPDAQAALVAAIGSALDEIATADSPKAVLEKWREKAGTLLGLAGPTIAKAAAKYLVGEHGGEELAELAAKGAGGTVNLVVTRHNAEKQAVRAMREHLTGFVESICSAGPKGNAGSAHPLERPLFVFIDELDRCRPTFAIAVLETIKHWFDAPGVVFVVGTNGDQLSKSICAAYGEQFDSAAYLRRFFDQRCSLPAVSGEPLWGAWLGQSGLASVLPYQWLAEFIDLLQVKLGLTLRDVRQLIERTRAVVPHQGYGFEAGLLALYLLALDMRYSADDPSESIRQMGFPTSPIPEKYRGWFAPSAQDSREDVFPELITLALLTKEYADDTARSVFAAYEVGPDGERALKRLRQQIRGQNWTRLLEAVRMAGTLG